MRIPTQTELIQLESALYRMKESQAQVKDFVLALAGESPSLEPLLIRLRSELTARIGWSLWVSAGITSADIENIWPEANMEFLTIKCQGEQWSRNWRIRDFNLRELQEVTAWVEQKLESPAENKQA